MGMECFAVYTNAVILMFCNGNQSTKPLSLLLYCIGIVIVIIVLSLGFTIPTFTNDKLLGAKVNCNAIMNFMKSEGKIMPHQHLCQLSDANLNNQV